MKRLLLIFIILVFFISCKSKYYMPNDTYKNKGENYKWYETREKKGITKTVHHPRWANNKS